MTKTYSIVGQKHRGLDPYLAGTLPGTDVVLVREPDNKFDPNAIMVWIDGQHVGYIPSKDAVALAQFIDQNGSELPIQRRIADDADTATTVVVTTIYRAINGKFARSPNSAYPQVVI